MPSSAYKWKLPNITEWNVDPESVKGLWIFGRTDGNLLHHNITEYDPDVVFDKMWFSQLFAQNFQVLIKNNA